MHTKFTSENLDIDETFAGQRCEQQTQTVAGESHEMFQYGWPVTLSLVAGSRLSCEEAISFAV
jgi:hypothetical protein